VRSGTFGYSLDLSLVDLDVLRFEAAVERAEHHQACLEHRDVIASCDGAASLWRGAPFEGCEAELCSGEIARLVELRSQLEDLRIGSMLAVGRGREVIPDLERGVATDPLRERTWAFLMTALHFAGRSSDALHAYGRARRALAEQLGIEPGPALRRVEEMVLRGETIAGPAGLSGLPLRRIGACSTGQRISGRTRWNAFAHGN
jgi:DNA-binding SARP family transcriptional activator